MSNFAWSASNIIYICLLQVFSSRDLTDNLTKSKDTLADTNIAWEKRVDAVSIIIVWV